MDTDLLLALGIVLLALSLPALLSGWSDSRLSVIGTLFLVAGAGLIAWAVYTAPDPYRLQDIPMVFLGVLARVMP